jgi:hypothetical protein
LGSYLKIDTDDLKVSLFKGVIHLKNVEGKIDGWNAELAEVRNTSVVKEASRRLEWGHS